MTVVVRTVRESDAPGMYRAWLAMREYNASLDHRIVPVPVSEAEFVAGLRETLGRPSSTAFIAEDGKTIVGFLSAGIEAGLPDRLPERHATIGYVYVDPEHRRKGVGRQLFEALAGWARAHDGVSHVEMTVLSGDAEAVGFWRSIGFTPFISRLWAPLDSGDGVA
jgi:ribosomal protein S18 acetylase RimI-like enzyme